MAGRDEILDLWVVGISRSEIAAKLGITIDTVRYAVNGARANGDPRAVFRKPGQKRTYFAEEALKRGISRKSLLALLLRTIEQDRLVNAVLDDEASQ